MGENFDTNDGKINQEPSSYSYRPEDQTSGRQSSDNVMPNQPQGYSQQDGSYQYQSQYNNQNQYQPQYNSQNQYQPQHTGQNQYQSQYNSQASGNPYQTYGYYQTDDQDGQSGSKGLAIASMVCGIVSLCLFCLWYISLPCAIVGLVLGIVSMKKKAGGRGMATAGVVTSIISLSLVIIFIIGVSGCMGYTGSIINKINNELYRYY